MALALTTNGARSRDVATWLAEVGEPDWNFPAKRKTAPREVLSPGPRDMEVSSMPMANPSSRAGGEVLDARLLHEQMQADVAQARACALRAARCADELMQREAQGGAQAHRKLMGVLGDLDEIAAIGSPRVARLAA